MSEPLDNQQATIHKRSSKRANQNFLLAFKSPISPFERVCYEVWSKPTSEQDPTGCRPGRKIRLQPLFWRCLTLQLGHSSAWTRAALNTSMMLPLLLYSNSGSGAVRALANASVNQLCLVRLGVNFPLPLHMPAVFTLLFTVFCWWP